MTLDELDELAAEKVMDFTADRKWKPTKNIEQAWDCLEAVGAELRVIQRSDSAGWVCQLRKTRGWHYGQGDTAAEAITRACVKAKSV